MEDNVFLRTIAKNIHHIIMVRTLYAPKSMVIFFSSKVNFKPVKIEITPSCQEQIDRIFPFNFGYTQYITNSILYG